MFQIGRVQEAVALRSHRPQQGFGAQPPCMQGAYTEGGSLNSENLGEFSENNAARPIKRTPRNSALQGYCRDSSREQPGKEPTIPGAGGGRDVRSASITPFCGDPTIKLYLGSRGTRNPRASRAPCCRWKKILTWSVEGGKKERKRNQIAEKGTLL